MRVTSGTGLFTVRRAVAAAAVVPLLFLAACGGGSSAFKEGDSGSGGGSKGSVVIAGQGYTEMEIMSNMYALLLQKEGYSTTIKEVQTRDLYGPSLESGKVDVVADYASSMTEYLNKEINGPDAKPVASPDTDKTIQELSQLGEKKNITPLQPAQAEDANAFAVTEDYASKHNLETLSDLGEMDQPIALAAAPDCPQRSDCKKGLESVYGIEIDKFEPLGFGTVQTKEALKKGEVQLGQVGTSDGSLAKLGLKVLEDDKNWQNAENLVPVVNADWYQKHKDVADVLNQLSDVLTTEDLKNLNAQVDVQRKLPEDVAKQYLQEKGLLG